MSRTKLENRMRRKKRIRKKIFGTPERPRLTVFKSLRYVYAQLIDDLNGKTLASASSLKMGKGAGNQNAASEVGKLLAEKAKATKIEQVSFDRNGFKYHGVIKSLADAVRQSGVQF